MPAIALLPLLLAPFRSRRLALRLAQWIGGLSLSSTLLLLLAFLTTIILRRKGYGVRLGLACLIFYARPGSRRFPDGVEVRLTSRLVGFLFGGCRGPCVDVSSERFYMRLRPARPHHHTHPAALSAPWRGVLKLLHVSSIGIAAVDQGYWSTLFRNLLTRLLAFAVRGLRVRVQKVRVWKDGGIWEYKAEQLVLAGRAVGLFGSRYSLSVNELYVNLCQPALVPSPLHPPINARLVLRHGVEINAFLTPRFFTLLRPRRMAILDDLRFSVTLRDVACTADHIFHAAISHAAVELCPGYSRSLRAKLPPSAPPTKRPRKPAVLRYWEGSATLTGLTARFSAPMLALQAPAAAPIAAMQLPTSVADATQTPVPASPVTTASPDPPPHPARGAENGAFLRIESMRVDAYGKAADERHEAMTHASVNVRGCSAGSTAVDALSHALYETMSRSSDKPDAARDANPTPSASPSAPDTVESVRNIDKIVAARPEALLWIEDLTAGVDVNCSKRHSMRVDVGGSGAVMAMEPVGLVALVDGMRDFAAKYVTRPPHRTRSASSVGTESASSIVRSISSSSLHSVDSEPDTTRVVCDLRAWTVVILGHGPVGDGDTMALVMSSKSVIAPQIDLLGGSSLKLVGSLTGFSLMHCGQWARTTNVVCEEATFDISRGPNDGKKLSFKGLSVDWDLDVQSGLESLPGILAVLKQLRRPPLLENSLEFESDDLVPNNPQLSSRGEWDRIQLTEVERRERRGSKHAKLLNALSKWGVDGSDVSISASFPDGPRLAASFASIPAFTLDAKSYVAHHVTLTLRDKKCIYGTEVRMDSPLHTMNRIMDKRNINVEVQGLRVILPYDFQFGFLLQDWLVRLRAVLAISREARLRRRGIPVQKSKKKALPDIVWKSSDIEIYFEDHPVGGFLTRMLPLMQDEYRERLVREELMQKRIQQLHKIARAEIAGTAQRCLDALKAMDSEIWIERVRKLKAATPGLRVANGYLPTLEVAPVATFQAASFCFSIIMDDLVRQRGSTESIRRLRMLDEYELGPQKYHKTRQQEVDAWNSLGFRDVEFEARGVRISFRDYNAAFVVIDRMRFDNTIFGQAVQATLPPYVAETTVAIGRRRVARVVKGLGPTKTFADIHLVIDTMQCLYNPAFLSAIGDFSRGVSRFFSGGKNPSPRIPWFDTLRVNMHGRMRLTAKKLKARLTSSISPYSMTKHYADIEADNFEMLASRLEATKEDPFPISWTLHNWHIRPSSFDDKLKSEVSFDYVRVGLEPQPTTLSGDTQDHYFVPFPSKEEVAAGGPGIGKAQYTMSFVDDPVQPRENGLGNYTNWTTGLHGIPGFDSFSHYKTHSMVLGVDICIRHAKADRSRANGFVGSHFAADRSSSFFSPPGASILHSDAISTLTKVVKKLIKRPISCRLAPRRINKNRKPPSKTGMTSTLRGLDVTVNASNLNVMLYNNLEPEHGLFISVASLTGELWKRTEISILDDDTIKRTSRMTRRRFDVVDIYSSIRAPGLDMAVDSNDMGKLLTVDKISLSDDLQDELPYIASPSRRGTNGLPASGFGSNDKSESPFYTFSATHPLQRGKKLDKMIYDKLLLVDRVRLIWSPVRRSAIAAWPDAFKEKSFVMKAPKAHFDDDDGDLFSRYNDSATAHESLSPSNPSPLPMNARGGDELLTDDEDLVNDPDDISDLDISERPPSSFVEESADAESMVSTSGQQERRGGSGRGVVDTLKVADITPSASSLGPETPASHQDPMSPQMLSTSRSKITAGRRPVGSILDLLSPYQRTSSSDSNTYGHSAEQDQAIGVMEVLETRPKFALAINDCQVVFGSPETTGIVFLTSRAVSVGIIDKKVQKNMQLGETNETWSDREYRVHLNAANLLTRSKTVGEFDFNKRTWVSDDDSENGPMDLVTTKPICLDLMYISSSSIPKGDGEDEEEDHILRPSLLFINTPDITLSTNADEFHAVVDIVRKVLMQSMRSSELVNEELANLRYKLQLAGGEVLSEDLDDFMRRLNNVTRQFLYAGDTFQEHLVDSLRLPDESSFADTLLRYKAKAKAVATFMRQDQRASSTDVLYPTMYVSYSFDNCSWELREKSRELNRDTEVPFVEITLNDLVCRHIFYVGRGSSTEMTFGNISARNKMSSTLQGILQPIGSGAKAQSGGADQKQSRIKASDGAPVAFRWYSTQEDRVGGIPVYDLLTIQVAPMSAAVTRKLYSSVSGFIFSTRSRPESRESMGGGVGKGGASVSRLNSKTGVSNSQNGGPIVETRNSNAESDVTGLGRKQTGTPMCSTNSVVPARSEMDDVSVMARRGESSMLFKYVFIDAFELTATYKNKENHARSVLDFFDLFVTTPSFSYSSQVWTWKDFSVQIRRDLVMTFARRSVSNLAKIKLLPGYSQARKRFIRGAEGMKERVYNSFTNSSATTLGAESIGNDMETFDPNLEDLDGDENSSSEPEEEDRDQAIDEAMAAIEEGMRRETILKLLYGTKTGGGRLSGSSSRQTLSGRTSRGSRSASARGSDSSLDGSRSRGTLHRGFRPPIPPHDRAQTNSIPSRASVDEEEVHLGQAPRASLFSRIRRKAKDLKEDIKHELEEGRW